MTSKGRVLRAFAAGICLALASSASAGITTTGDTGFGPPAYGTTNLMSYYVGRNADGTFQVDLGTSIVSYNAYVGYSPNCTGVAILTGTGSKWTNSVDFYVGYSGNGSLTVSNGGLVATDTLWASLSDLHGNGTITTRGAILDSELSFDSVHGATQSIAFGSGGTLKLSASSSSPLGVGYRTSGTLRIADGRNLASSYGSLGEGTGSFGAATVTGTGSAWTLSSDLYVGRSGSGSLTVTDGGLVTAKTLYASLADLHGNGTITTAGAVLDADLVFNSTHLQTQSMAFGSGGTLNLSVGSSNPLGVGYRSNGTLRISEGRRVGSTKGYLGYYPGSTGSATVSGAGSSWYNLANAYVGNSGTGTLNVEAGGTFSDDYGYIGHNPAAIGTATVAGVGSTWTNNSDLYVGNYGSGALNVQSGGRVSNVIGYLGYDSGASGTAAIAGAGSTWTNSADLYVGYGGGGSLTVADGGLVTAKTLWASLSDLHGNGTITTTGAVVDADLTFDSGHGASQSIRFDSAGTLNLNVSSATPLGAGYKTSGTVRIADGQSIASSYGYLGYHPGSNGSATVTGTGSKWTAGSDLYVGRSGSGAITIQAGGQISNSNNIYLGYSSGSSGMVTITGTGSKWTNQYRMYVGNSGDGVLRVEAGGQISTSLAYLGCNTGSTGMVTLAGSGSKWTSNSDLYVGSYGSGTLNIEAGAQLSNIGSYLGQSYGSKGAAVVKGVGSKWSCTSLQVGGSGNSTLRVEGGGQVISSEGDIGYASTSIVTVTGAGSNWSNGLNSSPLWVGYFGNGTLNIEAGGRVYSNNARMGVNSGATGTATVTGSGSAWMNSYDLYVGLGGNGSLTVADEGLVQTRTLWASLADLHGNGRINASGVVLDGDLIFDSEHGLTQSIAFGSGGNLNMSTSDLAGLGAGYNRTGTLRVAEGLSVASFDGYLGYKAGSSGTAIVTGTGSKWTNVTLYVGFSGTGAIRIEAGGQVKGGVLGWNAGSTGEAVVTGTGSKWIVDNNLEVGKSGKGTLQIFDSGQVIARSTSINSLSAVQLHVSGNDMFVLGNATTTGAVTNNGSIGVYADPFLPTGVYKPISEHAGRAMTWSGTGSVSAFGGAWDNTGKTFTVTNPIALLVDDVDALTTGERLVITDPATGRRVGASFGIVPAGATFSADAMGESDLASLAAMQEFTGDLLAGWDLQTSLAGSEVMLSFDLGTGLDADNLSIWHLHDGQWTKYTPKLKTYDEHGVLSFTVTEFSGYAVAVPEPSAVLLLAAAAMILRRRRISHR